MQSSHFIVVVCGNNSCRVSTELTECAGVEVRLKLLRLRLRWNLFQEFVMSGSMLNPKY
jgi:hypothetical protein